MRHLAVILVAAGSAMAADFATGQAARAIIGQPAYTAQTPTSSDVVLGGVSGLAYANGMLIVADANRVAASPINHRVVIFNNVSGFLPARTEPVPQLGRQEDPDGKSLRPCSLCVGKADIVLGQPDFQTTDFHVGAAGLRLPTAVATDGTRVAVADTDNNRVLIWNRIPTSQNAPADIVLGQPDFNGNMPNVQTGDVRVPSAKSLRSPQGVWIQDGRLFVADNQNHRVLIWNSFPTSNFKEADVVLGQPNFNTAISSDSWNTGIKADANTLLNPVSVTSDGVRVFVSDLGHNRVLIWSSIPSKNQQPADIVIGQPDMTSKTSNNSYTARIEGVDGEIPGGTAEVTAFQTGKKITARTKVLCGPDGGTDENDVATYPRRCAATLDYPRYALSDGKRLFIADGGNDRVLVFNQIPAQNGAAADVVLGQINDRLVQTSDTEGEPDTERRSSSDSVRTPTSLAWDGVNLFVSEPFSRRVMVFTPGDTPLPQTAVRNAASLDVYALGSVTFSGTVRENDEVTIKIRDKEYKYKLKKDDTYAVMIAAFIDQINAGDGDQWVFASANNALNALNLSSRVGGEAGNGTTLTVSRSPSDATILAAASGATMSGGGFAAKLGPGSLISIFGTNLSDTTAAAPPDADPLPTELAGVRVYIDGMAAPLISVSPTQVNAQLQFDVTEDMLGASLFSNVSAFVRTQHNDGTVTSTTAIGVPVVPANPGIFTYGGTDPRPAVALHASSQASGTIYLEGTAAKDDTVTVKIEDRSYSYKLEEKDTLEGVRDKLIDIINASDPQVYAFAGGQFRYIRLRARVEGPAGNGIKFSATSDGGNVVVGGVNSALCCANIAGAPVTADNPAIPGENIIIFATGLGMIQPDDAKKWVDTGFTYKGPVQNTPIESVSSMAGGKTAAVLYAGMKPGSVGLYEVNLELNSDLPTNPLTQLTIAQREYISNIVTIPVLNLNPSTDTTP